MKTIFLNETNLINLAELEAASMEEGLRFGKEGMETLLAQPTVTALGVREEAAPLLGFVLGRAVAEEAEILSIGVHPNVRRRGAGNLLLTSLLETWQKQGIKAVFLEVRQSNEPARKLYDGFGFKSVGSRARYYHNPTEDALVMRKEIS